MEKDQIEKKSSSKDFSLTAALIYIGLAIFLWIFISFTFFNSHKPIDLLTSLIAACISTSILVILVWVIIEIILGITGLFRKTNNTFLLLTRQVCLTAFVVLLISCGVCFIILAAPVPN